MQSLIQSGKGQIWRTQGSWFTPQASRSLYHSSSLSAQCPPCQLASQKLFRRPPQSNTTDRRSIHSTRIRKSSFNRESIDPSNKNPQTHYELFPKTLPSGPPPKGPFVIDVRALRNEYLQLQVKAHPDRHPAEMKKRAEATSARINEAYKTLQNPLKRAQYLLSLRGIDVAEDETAKVEDPDLLMEVLEAKEQIEDAADEEDLNELKELNAKRVRYSEEIIDKAFKEDDMKLATEEAVRLRYWVNIEESLQDWERGKPVIINH